MEQKSIYLNPDDNKNQMEELYKQFNKIVDNDETKYTNIEYIEDEENNPCKLMKVTGTLGDSKFVLEPRNIYNCYLTINDITICFDYEPWCHIGKGSDFSRIVYWLNKRIRQKYIFNKKTKKFEKPNILQKLLKLVRPGR